jgi:hypothetical protein
MKEVKVLHGHELSDLTDEHTLFDAADLNGIGITDELTPGAILTLPNQKKKKLTNELVAPVIQPVTTKAFDGQTWVDLVLQQLGDEERLFEMCDKNDAGITDDIIPGATIQSPEFEASKKGIVNALKARRPASDLVVQLGEPLPEGIEYWAIELDFEVS